MTKEDIRGIIHLTNYIWEEHFPKVSRLTRTQYRQISEEIEDKDKSLSTSSIERIFNFLKEPKNIRYESLDTLVHWCFDGGTYYNFLDYTLKNEENIKVEVKIPDDDLNDIINTLNSSKVKTSSSKKLNVNLGGVLLQIPLSEGNTNKLFNAIKPIIGDFLSNEIIKRKPFNGLSKESRVDMRLTLKEFRRQKNIEDIVAKAIEFCRINQSNTDETDNDWLTNFFNECQDCSNEKMQYLWAKILANEIDKPGTFSRRAVNAIKLLSSDEARIFGLLCNCLWVLYPGETRSDRILINNMNKQGYYSDSTWGFDGMLLRHLEDLGLIHETFFTIEKDNVYNISYFGKKHQLCTQDDFKEIDMVRLSTIGAEIYDLVMTKKNDAYYQFTLEYMKQEGILKMD